MQYRLEEFGIKVILIEPGVVKTNLFENTNSDSPYAELATSPIQVAEVVLKQ